MRLSTLLILALLLRMAVLFVQRSIGMDWDFHIDATYYVNGIFSMSDIGVSATLDETGYENFFYTLIGYGLYSMAFEYIAPHNLLIALNVGLSLVTIWVVNSLYECGDSRDIPIPALFFACSPYFSHLSIHPLKDSVVIFCSLILFLSLARNRWLFSIFFAVILILTRYHLGLITVMLLVGWRISLAMRLRTNFQIIGVLILMIALFFGAHEQLAERLDVEFEGRDFYPLGFSLVPDVLAIRYFLGGIFNFLVPYPFFPSRFADLGYFVHWMMFIFAAWIANGQRKLQDMAMNFSRAWLMMSAFFIFSFVLTTTPSAGPLVRYRLFAEILLLISLSPPMRIGTSRAIN